jgi:hypothetical protein
MSTKKQGERKDKTPKKTQTKGAGSHPGVGAYIKGMLIDGKSTEEILLAIARQFPAAQTTRSSVSWYRSKLRALGKL